MHCKSFEINEDTSLLLRISKLNQSLSPSIRPSSSFFTDITPRSLRPIERVWGTSYRQRIHPFTTLSNSSLSSQRSACMLLFPFYQSTRVRRAFTDVYQATPEGLVVIRSPMHQTGRPFTAQQHPPTMTPVPSLDFVKTMRIQTYNRRHHFSQILHPTVLKR